MYRLLGTDLTQIDGISGLTPHVFFTEVGPDLSKFKNVKHFCSWLGLCPDNKISGGKNFPYILYQGQIDLLTPFEFQPDLYLMLLRRRRIICFPLQSQGHRSICKVWGMVAQDLARYCLL
jgi:Transposase IS116/IS110/IS902 family